MTRFDSSIPAAKGMPFREATKRSPDRTINALLPLGLALGSGAVTVFAVWLIQLGLKLYGIRIGGGVALIGGGAVTLFTLVAGFAWMVKDKILWTYEEITGRDVTGDGWAGPPVKTLFELPARAGGLRLGELDYDPRLVIDWCEAAVGGGSLSFEAWIPRFALPDGTKGRERYTTFRDWLVKQRYAVNVGGPVGLRVNWRNPDAVTFVAGFAETTPDEGSPLLESIGQGQKKPPAYRLAHTSTLENDE